MIKKTVTYTDFNGVERTEDFLFNLGKEEALAMEMKADGGFSSYLEQVVASDDPAQIYTVFEEILKKTYGIKSADGRRFTKSDEIFQEFKETAAYEQILWELATDAEKSVEFVSGLFSDEMQQMIAQREAEEAGRPIPQDFQKKQQRPPAAERIVMPPREERGEFSPPHQEVLTQESTGNQVSLSKEEYEEYVRLRQQKQGE